MFIYRTSAPFSRNENRSSFAGRFSARPLRAAATVDLSSIHDAQYRITSLVRYAPFLAFAAELDVVGSPSAKRASGSIAPQLTLNLRTNVFMSAMHSFVAATVLCALILAALAETLPDAEWSIAVGPESCATVCAKTTSYCNQEKIRELDPATHFDAVADFFDKNGYPCQTRASAPNSALGVYAEIVSGRCFVASGSSGFTCDGGVKSGYIQRT